MDAVRTGSSLIACHRGYQRLFELLQRDRDNRAILLVNDIQVRDGYDSLQMDFQQAAIPNLEDMVGRIDIDDRLVACGIVDPGQGMWRYGFGCRRQMQASKCPESRQIEPVRFGCDISRVGRAGLRIGRAATNNVFDVAIHQLIAAIPAGAGRASRIRRTINFLAIVAGGVLVTLAPNLQLRRIVASGHEARSPAKIVRREMRG